MKISEFQYNKKYDTKTNITNIINRNIYICTEIKRKFKRNMI